TLEHFGQSLPRSWGSSEKYTPQESQKQGTFGWILLTISLLSDPQRQRSECPALAIGSTCSSGGTPNIRAICEPPLRNTDTAQGRSQPARLSPLRYAPP